MKSRLLSTIGVATLAIAACTPAATSTSTPSMAPGATGSAQPMSSHDMMSDSPAGSPAAMTDGGAADLRTDLN